MDERGLEAARFQWDEGQRRLRGLEPGSARDATERVIEQTVTELRRRLGGPFYAAELVSLYEAGTDWCLELAMEAAPSEPAAWDASISVDAAFSRYLREATDYAGGRIVAPYERDQG